MKYKVKKIVIVLRFENEESETTEPLHYQTVLFYTHLYQCDNIVEINYGAHQSLLFRLLNKINYYIVIVRLRALHQMMMFTYTQRTSRWVNIKDTILLFLWQ